MPSVLRGLGFLCLLTAFGLSAQEGSSRWDALDSQVETLFLKGDMKGALAVAQEALGVATTAAQKAKSQDRIGFLQYAMGDRKTGEKVMREAMELRRTQVGVESLDYAESAYNLAMVQRDSGQYKEAQRFAEEAVGIRRRLGGEKDRDYAESLNMLASIHSFTGEFDTAVRLYEQALASHSARMGGKPEGAHYGTLCANLASTYARIGRYDKAESTFHEALSVLKKDPGPGHPAYAATLIGFGTFEAGLGHYDQADRAYDEGGRLLRDLLGPEHMMYARFLNNRGNLYQNLGDFERAEADYRQSIALERKVAPTTPAIIAATGNLARVVSGRDPNEALKLLGEVKTYCAPRPNAQLLECSRSMLALGRLQRQMGSFQAAKETLEQGLDISAIAGENHPSRGALARELVLVQLALGDLESAVQSLKKARAIAMASLPPGHPEFAVYDEIEAAYQEKAGNMEAAVRLYASAFDSRVTYRQRILEIGSEATKTASAAQMTGQTSRLTTFQNRAGEASPTARRLAFAATVAAKDAMVDESRAWRQRLRSDAGLKLAPLVKEVEAFKACQTSLLIALGYPDLKPPLAGTCLLDEPPWPRSTKRYFTTYGPSGRRRLPTLQGMPSRTYKGGSTTARRRSAEACRPIRSCKDCLRSRIWPTGLANLSY